MTAAHADATQNGDAQPQLPPAPVSSPWQEAARQRSFSPYAQQDHNHHQLQTPDVGKSSFTAQKAPLPASGIPFMQPSQVTLKLPLPRSSFHSFLLTRPNCQSTVDAPDGAKYAMIPVMLRYGNLL